MKIRIALILAICTISSQMVSQLVVTVSGSKTETCIDTLIVFAAEASLGGTPVNNATFTWSFGDNTSIVSGLMLDTVEHSFSEDGGYIVRVDASDGTNSAYEQQRVQIALIPDFSGTKSDRDDPICLGQQIYLTGKTNTLFWKYAPPSVNIESSPVLINNSNIYTTAFDQRIFNKDQLITTSTDIDTVGIKLEHSNISELRIELKCPEGNSIILKDFGGPDKYFGEPIDDEGSNQAGTPYEYFWINSPTYGTINSISPSGSSYPSGSYTPEEPFSNLTGCSLNGNWEIVITDNQNTDNGFVFESQLKFDGSLIPSVWEYGNTYYSPLWLGSGVSSTSGTGLATAIPVTHGNHRYTFRVKDNYNCYHDTSFINSVEAVSFTTDPEPPTGDFDLSITFTSTTSWATSYSWDFGDQTDEAFSDTVTHIYTKDGTFQAILTASPDDDCSDTASVTVIVNIPKSVFDQMPGTFSPNGDGANDRYYLNETALNGIQYLDCWIYSRWGKKVDEWHSIEDAIRGWDGSINGGPEASSGVYYYYIKAVGFDGQVYEKKGAIQLFR